jgi:hypothetical protein
MLYWTSSSELMMAGLALFHRSYHACYSLTQRHTGQYMAEEVLKLLKAWDMDKKVGYRSHFDSLQLINISSLVGLWTTPAIAIRLQMSSQR